VWCCVQLSIGEGPCLLLHVMPVSQDLSSEPSKKHRTLNSRAGEGPGLQIFPGRVPEVAQVRLVSWLSLVHDYIMVHSLSWSDHPTYSHSRRCVASVISQSEADHPSLRQTHSAARQSYSVTHQLSTSCKACQHLLHVQVGSIFPNGDKIAFSIPKPLICSQLPADTTWPLELTLSLMDSPGELHTYDEEKKGRRRGVTSTPGGCLLSRSESCCYACMCMSSASQRIAHDRVQDAWTHFRPLTANSCSAGPAAVQIYCGWHNLNNLYILQLARDISDGAPCGM
jgi:hypothetical protein